MLVRGQRYIRLKEQVPLSSNELVPPESYRKAADDTLGAGPFRMEIDNDGFIKTGNRIGEGPHRIVVLGDSFVESSYAADHERFIAKAERLLNREHRNVQLYNGGYSGTTALQMSTTILSKTYPIIGSTGTVVVFATQSDINALDMDGGYWGKHKRYQPVVPSVEPVATDLAGGLDAARRVYTCIASITIALGMNLVFATTPFRMGDFNTDGALRRAYSRSQENYEKFLKDRVGLGQVVREVAEATGTPLIDGEAYMGGNADYFYDELHLNSLGQAQFGIYFKEQLKPYLRPPL